MDAEAVMKARLAVMMALVYSVQGAFWPLLSIHLGDLGISVRGRGWIFATMAMASFAMPLGAGQVVDRLMPTQRYVSTCFAFGSGLLALMAWGVSTHVGWLFGLFLAYWLVMAPCYSLCGSMAFRNLTRPDRDFGKVRLWGTVGWMAVGWLVSAVMAGSGPRAGRGASEAFWIAAGLSAATAIYCRTLPNTPPLDRRGPDDVEPGGRGRPAPDARDGRLPRPHLRRQPDDPVCLPGDAQLLAVRSGWIAAWVSTAMTLGQWPEVAMLAALPWLIRRRLPGSRSAWGSAAYASGSPAWRSTRRSGWPRRASRLHGVGVACFSIGGQMFVDEPGSRDRRASAQSINTVATGGLGLVLGSLLAGEVVRPLPRSVGPVFLVPLPDQRWPALLLLIAGSFAGPSGRRPEMPRDAGPDAAGSSRE